MVGSRRVLIAGESWTTHSIHQKGFDSFTTTEYAEGVVWLRDALLAGGFDVHYMPSHIAAREFPSTVEANRISGPTWSVRARFAHATPSAS